MSSSPPAPEPLSINRQGLAILAALPVLFTLHRLFLHRNHSSSSSSSSSASSSHSTSASTYSNPPSAPPGPRPANHIPKAEERVLILGASSGIGRALAHAYAERWARVCLVARRGKELDNVVRECEALEREYEHSVATQARGGHAGMEEGWEKEREGSVFGGRKRREGAVGKKRRRIVGVTADFSDVEDMVRVRSVVEEEWGGIDTLIVCAGASALRPLMEVAGLTPSPSDPRLFSPAQASTANIQHAVDITAAATRANYTGPLVAALTFIPLLQSASPAPSVLLISSLAALIPAPTRAVYGSTKAASLNLYQALAIEHPRVAFTLCTPYTVQGDFRSSAVDGGPVRENDPNASGGGRVAGSGGLGRWGLLASASALRPEDVAKRCVKALDWGDRIVFMPWWMRFGHWLYWIWPSFVEKKARKKYNFGT